MNQLLKKTKFIISIMELFHKEKLFYMQLILEEVNSAPDPQLRFFKAELRRLAMFEEKFLRIMENYPVDVYEMDQMAPTKVFKLIIGDTDY